MMSLLKFPVENWWISHSVESAITLLPVRAEYKEQKFEHTSHATLVESSPSNHILPATTFWQTANDGTNQTIHRETTQTAIYTSDGVMYRTVCCSNLFIDCITTYEFIVI